MPNVREDLLPHTAKAQKIKRMFRDCINMSESTVSQNFSSWDAIENSYRAYRPKDDDDRESLTKHNVQKIIVPIQFATVQTVLTFLMEVFTTLKPMLRVRGADPYSLNKARVMEIALDYDYRGNRGYFTTQQWFFNALRYGYGIIKNTWGTRSVLRKILTPSPTSTFTLLGEQFSVPGPPEFRTEPFITFEGNEWEIVDNRSFFFDPRWSLSRFQEGNFCGEWDFIHDHDLSELESEGLFFNTKEIKSTHLYGSSRVGEGGHASHQRDRFGGRKSLDTVLSEAKKNKMHLNETLIVKIIPRDYELSDETRPQDYIFNLIDDYIFVRAEPSVFLPRFPYSVIESYPDVLATMSQGLMELTEPLAQHLNFLFNSHMANVRKAVNDRFIADPSRVDLEDFLDPDNSVVRLLPAAYGTNPVEALQQLSVVDITRNHLGDIQSIVEFWERVTGATSHMFGQISSGRRTALELQGVFRQSGARLKMMADLMSAQGVAPLTEQMALLRQENMSIEQFMEIAGYSAAELGVKPTDIINGFLNVSKTHLNGVFRFPAEEGVLPQDRAAAAEALQYLFDAVTQQPYLTQTFDPVTIFKELIRQRGLRNLDDFVQRGIKAETLIMTPDQIGELYAANKIQPANITGNRPGRRDEGVTRERETLSMEGAFNGAGSPRQAT